MSQRELITLILLILLSVAICTISAWFFEKRRKVTGVIIAALGLCPLALALFLFIMFQRTQHPLRYEKSITSPDGEYVFAMFEDDRIGEDTSWHVFKLSQNINAKRYRIPANYINLTSEQSNQWRQNRVLYVSAKGEEYVGNAYLYIVHDKYLALVRNGLFQGLYDIKAERTIIDDQSRIFAADVIDNKQAAEFIDNLSALLKCPKLNDDEMEELIAGIQRSHVNESILNTINQDKIDPNS